MTTIMKIFTILILTIIVIFGMTNCSQSVSLEDYNSLKSELEDAKSQLTALQGELDEAASIEEQYQSLNISYEELQKECDAKSDEIQRLNTKYDELNTKYKQLMESGDVEDTIFDVEEIEQAIFTLVNQERTNNDVDELEWGIHLYDKCKYNSRVMAESGKFQYPQEEFTTGEIFAATKYTSVDQIADATLTIWKNNEYQYRYQIINDQHIYGAVGVERAGSTYYITFLVSIYK